MCTQAWWLCCCQNAKTALKAKAKVDNEDEGNSADGDTSTGDDSGEDNGPASVDSNVGDDEDMWDELQREARKESILETKSKETHPVHAPYFPNVSLCSLQTSVM